MKIKHEELVMYNPSNGIFYSTKDIRPLGILHHTIKDGILNRHGTGYITIFIYRYGNVLAHRLAWFYCHGKWPNGQIDHINRIRSDNRLHNLRDITPSQNVHNSSSHRLRKVLHYNCYSNESYLDRNNENDIALWS